MHWRLWEFLRCENRFIFCNFLFSKSLHNNLFNFNPDDWVSFKEIPSSSPIIIATLSNSGVKAEEQSGSEASPFKTSAFPQLLQSISIHPAQKCQHYKTAAVRPRSASANVLREQQRLLYSSSSSPLSAYYYTIPWHSPFFLRCGAFSAAAPSILTDNAPHHFIDPPTIQHPLHSAPANYLCEFYFMMLTSRNMLITTRNYGEMNYWNYHKHFASDHSFELKTTLNWLPFILSGQLFKWTDDQRQEEEAFILVDALYRSIIVVSSLLLLWTCGCCCWEETSAPHSVLCCRHLSVLVVQSNSLEKRFNCPLPIAIKRFNAFNYGRHRWITHLKAFFSISFNVPLLYHYVRWWLEISLIMPILE